MRMRANVRPNVGPVTDVMRRAAAEAVVEVAEDVLTEANDRVPVDQGDLRRSGEVVADTDQGIAAVTFDTPYAVRQHEDPTLQHPRGGEAGFLRKAVEENEQRYFQHIADAIRDAAS